MRYLIGIDEERGEGVLCTETGIALRHVKTENGDVLRLIENMTEKMPVPTRQTAIHICLGDRADGAACDRLEAEITAKMGEKTAVACEDRMVHRLYSCFEKDEPGVVLYAFPDAGAGRLHEGGLAVVGGMGAPVWSAGSCYLLAADTIRAALSAADKTGRPTVLTSLLEQAVGLPIEDVRQEISKMTDEKIASYARLAAKGNALGDAVATELCEAMTAPLAEYVRALSLSGESVAVKITEVPSFLRPFLKKELGKLLGKGFTLSFSDAPILLGGVRRAGEMLGLSCGADFCRTFLETYSVVRK